MMMMMMMLTTDKPPPPGTPLYSPLVPSSFEPPSIPLLPPLHLSTSPPLHHPLYYVLTPRPYTPSHPESAFSTRRPAHRSSCRSRVRVRSRPWVRGHRGAPSSVGRGFAFSALGRRGRECLTGAERGPRRGGRLAVWRMRNPWSVLGEEVRLFR
jgi:hypothetical protein